VSDHRSVQDRRHAPGYEPRFDLDAELGHQGQLFVARIADGLRDGTVEIKTDDRARETGRVYVEFACLRRPPGARESAWLPSGIAATEADWWAFVLADLSVLVALPTATMLRIARQAWKVRAQRVTTHRGSHPTQGVAVPIGRFVEQAVRLGADWRIAP
jgi:hypothetical protein